MEIERIQQERVQRRANQEARRQDMLDGMDAASPNRDFLRMIIEWQEQLPPIEKVSENDPIKDHRICVCVRKRPINKKEVATKQVDVLTITSKDTVVVHEPKLKVRARVARLTLFEMCERHHW